MYLDNGFLSNNRGHTPEEFSSQRPVLRGLLFDASAAKDISLVCSTPRYQAMGGELVEIHERKLLHLQLDVAPLLHVPSSPVERSYIAFYLASLDYGPLSASLTHIKRRRTKLYAARLYVTYAQRL